MSIRKRVLPASKQVRWLLDYKDAQGKRRHKQFKLQREAENFETTVRSELKLGVHVPDSASVTIGQAAEFWLKECRDLEKGTLRGYRQHLDLHILPLLRTMKLSRLTRPAVEAFKDKLLETRSPNLTKRVMISLKSLLSEAQRRGLIAQNVAMDVKVRQPGARHEKQLTIPSKDEIRALITKTAELWPMNEPWRALMITALFTGLRSSELRGLAWDCIDFERKVVKVRQRADFLNELGSPKSKAGNRDVPLSPTVINTLRTWKLACPSSELVFAMPNGTIIRGSEIRRRWAALLCACDLSGYRFHDLRHVAASLFIEQGWQAKKVQAVMGHGSVKMTFDLYGHLWPDAEDDAAAMAQIEARLLR